MEHGFRFQAIDLRWGVSKEASLSQETMRICLQEIKRCQEVTPKPNFIILLGDRYGWQPIPEEIPENEFKQIKDVIKKHKKDFDRIAEEVSGLNAEELLDKWYREDKNTVPPVYILQPVDPESMYTDSELWDKEVQQPLLHILRKAIQKLDLSYEERLKYEASATHQEIELGAMRVDDADEHVFGFFRQIKNIDELKKEELSEQPAQDLVETNVEDKFDESAYKKLKSLKQRLREKLGKDNVISYDAEWQVNGITIDHLNKLCKDVYDNLSNIIRKQIDQMDEKEPLEKEIDAHEDFRKDRAKHFIGRADMLEKIKNYIKDENNHPLTIHGKSGTGKSALLAFAVKKTNENFPKAAIAFRSIGATPSSSDGRSLLEILCRQVSKIYEADETDIPADYEELIKEFPKRLALATPEKPLILFIDALDQLSDANNARDLAWLPSDLPENVNLIVSTLPGECYEALKKRLPEDNLRELKPMPPEEGERLLNVWLDDAHRTLQFNQRKEILDNFNRKDNGNPLYLKLAFEEALRWKSYTEEEETKLSPDIPGIIQNLFKRLSLKENHGEMMVSRSLGYLVAAKNGLSEDELLDVLSSDEEFFQDFLDRAYHKPPKNRLPVIVWSRLYFDLEPYLIERSADGAVLMTFYHRKFKEVVKKRYYSGENKHKLHSQLAKHFKKRWHKPNIHALNELPYQLNKSDNQKGLVILMTNIHYLDDRCGNCDIYSLIQDYELIHPNYYDKAKQYHDFILKHSQRLTKYKGILFSLIYHEGFPSAVKNAKEIAQKGLWQKPWINTSLAWMPFEQAEKLHPSAKIINQWNFEMTGISTLSEDGNFLFYLGCLGEIKILDVENGIELPNVIKTKKIRPCKIVISRELQYLAIAYDNGEADLFKFGHSERGMFNEQEEIESIEYFVPDFGVPTFKFFQDEFLYQNANKEIIGINLNNKKKSIIFSQPENRKCELSGIASTQNYLIVALNEENKSEILIFSCNKSTEKCELVGKKSIEHADILSVWLYEPEIISVSFINHKVIFFKISQNLEILYEINMEEIPVCMAKLDTGIVYVSQMGDLFNVEFDSFDNPCNVSKIEIKIPEPQSLIRKTNNILVVANKYTVLSFSIEHEDVPSSHTIEEVFKTEENGYYAIQTRNDRKWLLDAFSKGEIPLEIESRSYCLFDIDGEKNILCLDLYRPENRYITNPSRNDKNLLENCPINIVSIAGNPSKGFWLADSFGAIYFTDVEGICIKKTQEIQAESGNFWLKAYPDLLIQTGFSIFRTRFGMEYLYYMTFYESDHRNNGKIRLLGKRHFEVNDGKCLSMTYDYLSQEVLIFWGNGPKLKRGTPTQFIQNQEKEQKLSEINETITDSKVSQKDSNVYILSNKGTIFILDSSDLHIKTEFSCSEPITSIGKSFDSQEPFVFIKNKSKIIFVKYMEAKKNGYSI